MSQLENHNLTFNFSLTPDNMASITSIAKASDFILSRPSLAKIVVPVAKVFTAYAGYREMGLK